MSVLSYIRFWLRSGNAHGLHSPFVFDLYTRVIKFDGRYYVFDEIEKIRDAMLFSEKKIEVLDLGAGSKKDHAEKPAKEKYLKDIAKISAKTPKLGQLLYRLVYEFKPQVIFDLGTSLGITTMYLASANSKSTVYTFEGCPNTASVAKENFGHLRLKNIRSVIGNLDKILSENVEKVDRLDFVFFDANHRLEPTLNYFEACLQKAHEQSVFVFDDIYWSQEMAEAWEQIKNHPSVTITVDLFHIGLVFFRKENLEKLHYTLRI